MSAKLEKYLEEIGHYLALGPGRDEILSEIRSHKNRISRTMNTGKIPL